MRRLSPCLLLLAATSVAHADDGPRYEVGAYGGGFISNYFHGYYDTSKFPGDSKNGLMEREELTKLTPLFGVRFLYLVKPWFGVEGDLGLNMASTKTTNQSATIVSGRVQAVFQYAKLGKVVPYASIGDGFGHISGPDSTGSATVFPLSLGIGARFLVTDKITIRLEGRFLRGPGERSPHTLGASYADFGLGVSYRFGSGAAGGGGGGETHLSSTADSDGDGIVDASDKCPEKAEDKDLFEDTDGCPELDNDGDGVDDATDKCPLEAEDKDGFQDDDGCVDPDNDGDGVADAQDKCANEAEDKDNFQDDDGCPDLDNDADGFPDAKDACPNEAEVINGNKDDDGCPDKGDSLVLVSPDRLELLEPVQFNKALILKSSINVIQQLAATLKAHPEILRIRITSFVQPTKNTAGDKQLTELRAFAVREALIKYGVAENRLDPRGFGGEKPLVDPKTKNAGAINDRIEIIVLERK